MASRINYKNRSTVSGCFGIDACTTFLWKTGMLGSRTSELILPVHTGPADRLGWPKFIFERTCGPIWLRHGQYIFYFNTQVSAIREANWSMPSGTSRTPLRVFFGILYGSYAKFLIYLDETYSNQSFWLENNSSQKLASSVDVFCCLRKQLESTS